MASLEEIRTERLKKLEILKQKGLNPYPAKSNRNTSVADALNNFDSWKDNKTICIAGRVTALREHGGSAFVDIYDGTGKIQAYLKKDELAESYDLFNSVVDIGDFIEVEGIPFLTKREEKSLLVKNWRMLTKSLRPLPDKWHGLQDNEERFRKRYLDLIFNPEIKSLFEKKTKFWDVTRTFMKDHGFLEVETPTLEVTTGGAEATPFKTYHEDFNLDVFMRISIGELWQKRLMAAGFEKTFEIGRAYRNEGSDMNHVQEFTNMEFYWSYANYRDGMNLVKDLYRIIAKEVFGTTEFTTRGHSFDLTEEWQELDYQKIVLEKTGVDILTASDQQIKDKLAELKVVYQGENRERLTDTLWKYCRKQISGPAFLINHPKLVSALSKENPSNPELTERFQIILAGSEVGNGYSELNDPIDQRNRFEIQQKLLEQGDTEAMMPDWEFVEMLEHGMPPTCGFGFGEMLFAFLADKTIREVQLFPLMKPDKNEVQVSKSKETKIAVAVVNTGAGLERWQEMNTVAHLNAAFGARTGQRLFSRHNVETKDNQKINLNIQHAILIKKTDNQNLLHNLVIQAKSLGLETEEFTREMIETTNDNKVADKTKSKDKSEIEYLGVLVFGPKGEIDVLTKELELYS